MGKMEQEKLTPIIVCLQSKQEPIINYLFIRFIFLKSILISFTCDSKQKLNHCNLAKINNTKKRWP